MNIFEMLDSINTQLPKLKGEITRDLVTFENAITFRVFHQNAKRLQVTYRIDLDKIIYGNDERAYFEHIVRDIVHRAKKCAESEGYL